MTSNQPDRYTSFQGIECDANARHLLDRIQYHLEHHTQPSPWLDYFQRKLSERQKLGQDELFFVGSQINNIRSLFEQFEDTEALSLLDQVENDCC